MDNIEDSAVEYLAFGIPSSAWGNFGLSMTLVHFGEPIHKTGRSGEDLGLISAWHSITSLSYATNIIPSLRFGANFKFLLSSLAGVKGYTEVADIGLQYDLLDDFCIGLGVKNWGPDIQYIDKYQSDPPATRLVLGLRYQLLGDEVNNLFFVYDVYKSLINLDASFDEQKKEMKNYLGAEYTYMNMLSFRYGYKFEKYTATSGSTYGMGVHFKNFQIDFAQIEGSDLGNKQIFSIISNF
jgi:hypothetical protein